MRDSRNNRLIDIMPHSENTSRRFWLNRFEITAETGDYIFRDRLQTRERRIHRSSHEGCTGLSDLDQGTFIKGFLKPTYTALPAGIRNAPLSSTDLLFWQFPCRTEAAAFELHAELPEAGISDSAAHCYVGLPWATWIDKLRAHRTLPEATFQIRLLATQLRGLRRLFESLNIQLKVHTVCQHIYWHTILHYCEQLGVTDLWLAHASEGGPRETSTGMHLHPWHLYAVNVADQQRRQGLKVGMDPMNKRYLASFIGTHMTHYITDARLRLRALSATPRFFIQVNEDKWHFEDVVYRHQVLAEPIERTYQIDESVESYNQVLSDSIFSLCPSGAGPNTLRLWESLAIGAIPVLMGPAPRLPTGGEISASDWDRIVLRVSLDEIPFLNEILSRVPLEELRERQQRGMNAYKQVTSRRCF